MGDRTGSPNKNKQALIVLLQTKYPEYHPVMELAAIANNDVTCDICKGEGKKPLFAGVEVSDEGTEDKYSDEPCEFCVGGKSIISLDMKFNANKEVAQYVTAKLKAVEVTGKDGGAIETKEVGGNDLARRLAYVLTQAVENAD